MIAPAIPVPNDEGKIIFTYADQQRIESAKWIAEELLKEKYPMYLQEIQDALHPNEVDEDNNWWD